MAGTLIKLQVAKNSDWLRGSNPILFSIISRLMLCFPSSRIFMRLHTDKIKFVTVDEPSSALDPQGEQELFQRLRDAKGGKTMIFVTHRFGHLTRHADQIM